MAADVYRIDLYLSDIRNFFQVPDVDPFAGDDIDLSGIDQLMDALKARPDWRRTGVEAVVHLPVTAAGDPRAARLPAALDRYCRIQSEYSRRKVTELRLEGRHAMRMGALFLVICMALSGVFEKLVGAEGFLGRVLVEGLVIAGWVGLWHPLDLLLYSWWPYARDIKLYEKIKAMPVEMAFDRQAPGSAEDLTRLAPVVREEREA